MARCVCELYRGWRASGFLEKRWGADADVIIWGATESVMGTETNELSMSDAIETTYKKFTYHVH